MKKTGLVFLSALVSALTLMIAAPHAMGASRNVNISQLLALVQVDDTKVPEPYVAKEFLFPVDADKDGCSTVNEVLLSESKTKVKIGKRCQLSGGQWVSPFSSKPVLLKDGPKVVPIVTSEEAWKSGASKWPESAKVKFANDMGYSWALMVLPKGIAKAKGNKDISQWLPQGSSSKCLYVAAYLATKYRWGLTLDSNEAVVAKKYAQSCGSKGAVVRPNISTITLASVSPTPTPIPSVSPSPTPTPTPSASPTPTPSASPTSPVNQTTSPVYSAAFSNPPENVLTTEATSLSVVVTDQNGNPAPAGISISFKFRASSFTSVFTSIGTAATDSSGTATIQYRFSAGTPQVFAGSEATSGYARFWSVAHNLTAAAPVYSASLLNPPANALTTQETSLSASVVDQNGNPAAGISVSFKFRPNTSTSSYTIMGTDTTSSSGIATIQYRFSAGTPQIFAGSEATANYQRFWSTGHTLTAAAPVYSASLLNPPANALTTQETSLSASVVDQNGNPAAGISVSFKYRASSLTSTYTSMGSGTTNSSGIATIQYRFSAGTPQIFAGSAATADYQSFWSTGHTVTAAAPVYSAAFSNPPSTAVTSQAASISAVVVDQNGNAAAGITLSFKFRPNTSTSFYTIMGSAITDSSGVATLQYRFTSAGTPQVFAGSEATSDFQRFWSTGHSITVRTG